MSYVDGFVAAVPNANKEAFRAHAEEAASIFKENGALSVTDCWGDDVPEGDLTSLPLAVKAQPDETVVFSWILWPSKDVRDTAWEKLMSDERFSPEKMPFDGKRMIYGGFETIMEA